MNDRSRRRPASIRETHAARLRRRPAAAPACAVDEPAAPDRRCDPGPGAAADRGRRGRPRTSSPARASRSATRGRAPRPAASTSAAPTSRSRPHPAKATAWSARAAPSPAPWKCTAMPSRTASPRCARVDGLPIKGGQSVVLEARRLSRHAARPEAAPQGGRPSQLHARPSRRPATSRWRPPSSRSAPRDRTASTASPARRTRRLGGGTTTSTESVVAGLSAQPWHAPVLAITPSRAANAWACVLSAVFTSAPALA